jgi:uncharacterized protein YdaU (DUF1376 family)
MSEARLILNAEERAIYRELLDELYRNGTLTNDEQILYRICAVSQQEWDRSWPQVRKFFIRDGRNLVNRKAKEVIEKLDTYEGQRHASAKTAAEARWRKPKDAPRIASRIANALPENAHPQPQPYPHPQPQPQPELSGSLRDAVSITSPNSGLPAAEVAAHSTGVQEGAANGLLTGTAVDAPSKPRKKLPGETRLEYELWQQEQERKGRIQ